MTEDQVLLAAEKLKQIKELEEYISSKCIELKAVTDWSFGCGIHPHRLAMLHAVDDAKAAAVAIMRSAAERQISILKRELSEIGVKEKSND